MSQRLKPQNYARIALVFVELKYESTSSEGGSSLAQYLSKLEGGKRQCSHSMLLCSVSFSERKKSTFHTFARQQFEKNYFTLIFPIRFWKAFSVDLNFLYLLKNKNLEQTEDTLFASLFENNWNGKYSKCLRLVSLFFKLTTQHWHLIIPLLLRIFLEMARERSISYQAGGMHVLIKQFETINLNLREPQVLPIMYSQPTCYSLLSFVYNEENQTPSASGVRRDVQHGIFNLFIGRELWNARIKVWSAKNQKQ